MTHCNNESKNTVDFYWYCRSNRKICFMCVLKYQRMKDISQEFFSRLSETHRKWTSRTLGQRALLQGNFEIKFWLHCMYLEIRTVKLHIAILNWESVALVCWLKREVLGRLVWLRISETSWFLWKPVIYTWVLGFCNFSPCLRWSLRA